LEIREDLVLKKSPNEPASVIIKIHRKLLPALKSAGLTEFSFESGFLGHKEN